MSRKTETRLVREGDLVAEVVVALLDDAGDWSPTISVQDATKLDDVRRALRSGDVRHAAQLATHLYRLTPLALTDAR